jgi:hypothetical protein
MGQDTYADLGYGVSLEINQENMELIIKAWHSNEVSTYLSDDDEALLTEDYTQTEFENELKNRIDIPDKNKVYFFRSAVCVDARNISRRDTPRLFNDLCTSLDELVNNFKEGKEKFLELGFKEEDIQLKYMFEDSY